MVVRLAFAVAINVDPEILLVDEALAVGDIYFRQRCMRKVHELRARGITILFVSHAVADVKAIGDRVLWLDHGRMVEIGETGARDGQIPGGHGREGSAYLQLQGAPESAAPQRERVRAPEMVETIPNIDHRYGDGRAEIIGIAVLDEHGEPAASAGAGAAHRGAHQRAGQRGRARMPIVGFMMRNHLGMDFSGTNTAREGYELPPMQRGRHLHGGFPPGAAGTVPGVVFLFAGHRRRHAAGLQDVRLDRQRHGPADGARRRPDLRLHASALPRGSECAAGAPEPGRRLYWRSVLAEFTGERVIPGQVDVDLLNEHLARYTFAARLARGKRVLDAGCGAGYGSAELAQPADVGGGRRLRAPKPSSSRAPTIGCPICSFEQASCTALPHPMRASTWWWRSK